jgi:hypothetical protein
MSWVRFGTRDFAARKLRGVQPQLKRVQAHNAIQDSDSEIVVQPQLRPRSSPPWLQDSVSEIVVQPQQRRASPGTST